MSHTFALPFWKEVVETEVIPGFILDEAHIDRPEATGFKFITTFFEWMIIDSGPVTFARES